MSGTPSSGKTFFIQYLTEYYMLLKKKVILTVTTGCAASRLSSKTSTIHNTFHIQCKGYVRPLQESSVEFQILKEANIIIIDEMSMMTSTLLQSVETRL
jgi:ATP-dependent exoDNAse (exonuclease V) alpha subunit